MTTAPTSADDQGPVTFNAPGVDTTGAEARVLASRRDGEIEPDRFEAKLRLAEAQEGTLRLRVSEAPDAATGGIPVLNALIFALRRDFLQRATDQVNVLADRQQAVDQELIDILVEMVREVSDSRREIFRLTERVQVLEAQIAALQARAPGEPQA